MGLALLAAALVGGAVTQWLLQSTTAHAAEPRVVRAEKMVLVDPEGREYAVIGMTPEGPAFVLRDAEGRSRVHLGQTGCEEPYWSLAFVDAKGHNRFTCGARVDGKGSGMGVFDWNGTLRAGLGAEEYGCGLALHNEDATEIVGIGAGPGGGGDLALKHPFDGRVMWRASDQRRAAEGQPATAEVRARKLVLVDEQGREHALLHVADDGVRFALQDAEGRPRVLLGGMRFAHVPDQEAWGMAVQDAGGKPRCVVGAADGAGLGVWDARGTMRIGLGEGGPGVGLGLMNFDGKEIVSIGGEAGGDLVLKHPHDGHEMWRASWHRREPAAE
jgi:hypothetical protein